MQASRLISLVLVVSLIVNISLVTMLFTSEQGGSHQVEERLTSLEASNAELQTQLDQSNLSAEQAASQLAFYRSHLQTSTAYQVNDSGVSSAGISGTASLMAPAVMQRTVLNQSGRFITRQTISEGSMINISVEVTPGRGRVLVQTSPLMGEVFQDAANTAVAVAENRTGTNLSESDAIISIVADDRVPEVNGPSAGALMTLLLISVLDQRPVRQDVTATGTIDENGQIGAIGGVVEKATAAKASGKTLLLLSRENSELTLFRGEEQQYYGFHVLQQVPYQVDTKQYIESTIGIRVEYVDTIDDLVRLAT
ncbi:S16 family serine protease [Methanosphaerula palustris]|uniref:Peptidase S16 lon domain protein n=1 Tax=Methanosphaerula palustris (strain ATCC BAA-1556 / DSM 19958 / E1-9c) TaxID=521011 RepID=B8GKU1_METPE|nr:S16 family serine protease [Methanosphaerula palustris]ACL17237.1 peptidase S16 lon domain protein [Methanosphaerula palustris E1-9c]